VRDEADLHNARIGVWHDTPTTLTYLSAHIAHRDFATL